MKCPYCQSGNDRVVDSRGSHDDYAIRRRRECLGCRRRFTTYEQIEEVVVKVIKKDGSRVPLDRAKMVQGLARACWKRPISDNQIETMVAAVEADIYSQFEREVESQYLGEMLMRQLRELDQVAYVRFASVYREFKDVRDFVEELQPMLAENRHAPR